MPNRYIREGLIDSDSVNALSDQAFNFYVRLLLKADDFGRFDGREIVLKSSLYPLKPEKRVSDISRWLAECEKSGLIVLYAVDGKKYIEILNFNQQIRIKHSKYPAFQPQNKGKMLSRCSADDKHMLTSITYNRRHITRDAIASSAGAREFSFPKKFQNEKFKEVWKSWVEYFKGKYFDLITQGQADLIFKKLMAHDSDTAVAMIEQAIEKGWKHCTYELKEEETKLENGGYVSEDELNKIEGDA